MSLYNELIKIENKSAYFPTIFDKITIGKDFLSSCTIELTPLCNFRCPFCYARLSAEDLKQRNVCVMGFGEIRRYLDELAEMNCVTLTLTGGECTLHPEFPEIYSYAYEKGFVINIFTNGSNITDEILSAFEKMPPSRIYVTLYGASEETYEKVTGNGKYYEIVKRNVRRLAEKKFDVIIQGTFTEINLPDMEKIFEFASEVGCEYRYSTKLQKYGHCTDELLEEIGADEERAKQMSRNIWHKKRGLDPDVSKNNIKRRIEPIKKDPSLVGIKCNAGKNTCFIRHDGMMMACNMFDAYLVDTRGKSIRKCFEELNRWANSVPRISECEGCIHAIHCTTCVAAHYNDTKELGATSPRICFKKLQPGRAALEREFYEKHGYLEV